ncbi:MAG: DUF4139 domain-containing protein [Desulfovibrio sp.]|nr:DUF4139 domain-containing protein [Desulfovibrio sp.]
MRNIFGLLGFALWLWPALALAAAPEEASLDELASPRTALLSPTGARLEVSQKLEVKKHEGKPVVEFVIPADAANLQLSIPGRTIARWHTTPVLLNQGSPLAGRRAEIEKAKIDISAKLKTVNARLALWQGLPKSANSQDVEQLQGAMQSAMPQLWLEQARLERELKLINEELSRMPRPSDLGERVRVELGGDAAEGGEVTVDYSYNHDGCGWEAVYDFNTRPNEGERDEIDVRMLAEVWQYTGINWDNTEITLATKSYGPREPAALPEWVIDSASRRPQERNAPAPMAIRAMKTEAAADAAGPVAGVTANTDAIYATWKLAERGLSQGRSRMQITAAAWKAPLQWLARPSRNSSQVWLMAKYDLPPNQAWPAGLAEYSVNGQNVGTGEFRPRSGEATLYFGADPRVTVTTTDTRQRGESGLINTSKSWTWGWVYTIHNGHNEPIKVRVERPYPMIVDKEVKISYRNAPEPKVDAREHSFYWIVDVPANGKTEISHEVTVTSPTKLPLLPDVP